MEVHSVNNAMNLTAPKPSASSPSAVAGSSSSPIEVDTVNLSKEGQSLIQPGKVSSSTATSTGIEQRKLLITDNNDVVLEVIDPQTKKVIRTVPSEEQLELRDAIRDELDKI